MSDQRIAELYELLMAAKFTVGKPIHLYPFQLGWNAAIDFAVQKLNLVCDEVEQSEPAE